MNVIVHYPANTQGLADLERQVSSIHTQAISDYILNLDISKEEKLKLLSQLSQYAKDFETG